MAGDKMEKIRVIFISSVRPEPTSAGQIILHRHLVDQPGIELEVYGGEPKRFSLSMVLRRVLGKLSKWGGLFEIAVNCLWVLWEGCWIDGELPSQVPLGGKTVVMTVAHGEGFRAAQRFAKRHNLPLVVFFQDWWPDMAPVPIFFKGIFEKQFWGLARKCSLGLCVCEGMREALGGGDNLQVLHDIPAKRENVEIALQRERKPGFPFRVLYFGNLGEYGPMLGEALGESLKHPEILLQVRGSNPNWSNDFKQKMRANGRWLEFAPRAELEEWLASADAFLVPMVFDPKMRRRMETSFPSKLIEFVQFGKPLIVWGPKYCSAVKWAAKMDSAVCSKKSDPIDLLNKIECLSRDKFCIKKFSQKTTLLADSDFNPLIIHQKFSDFLSEQIHKHYQNKSCQ